MRIFVAIPHKYAGCGFYRQYQPHNRLAKTHKVDVLSGAGLQDEQGNYVDFDFDIAQFHKGYFDFPTITELRKKGVITIVEDESLKTGVKKND